MSKQDKDLHDGEILDAVSASGKEDTLSMYPDKVTGSVSQRRDTAYRSKESTCSRV